MNDLFNSLRVALLGLPLAEVWRGDGSAIFCEFGNLTARKRSDGSTGHPWGEISVGLEFDWRIEKDAAIVCGSGGNRELWDAHFRRITGATAIELSLFGTVPELSLELSTGHRLQTYSLYEDGPDWALTDRRGDEEMWVYWEDGHIICSEGTHLGPQSRPLR
ncbi:hypothetical protein KNJ79_11695 [Sphingopyxis indica]|uniref:hypothetical protein n=1 Tax=Sphingopyxis indica TaxID=436663 RepID=UPI0029394A79|nr:hypothetical protein [Sphingopyxis indica]WOF41906.1 hypothetical protein KNJ79_11695 [Sphingopyxis indica]